MAVLLALAYNAAVATPTTVVDLRTQVENYWDRGLLGFAVDPQFLAGRPYLYLLYARDARTIGGPAPYWGSPDTDSESCPNPPGATKDGCVISGRLSRIHVDTATSVADQPEQVLIDDWCQQFPSHSTGTVAFGPDGQLYASGGDGASFSFVDYGQRGYPDVNPCGDPPDGVGGNRGWLGPPPGARATALNAQNSG